MAALAWAAGAPASASTTTTACNVGRVAGASDQVLDGIARALQLDDAERTHLLVLVRAVHGTAAPRRRNPVGELSMKSEALPSSPTPRNPGRVTSKRLKLLASWAATADAEASRVTAGA